VTHDKAIRQVLEDRRDRARERLAALAERPERGSAVGFGKRIGDGTSEAVSRLTDIGVGDSLERGMRRTERGVDVVLERGRDGGGLAGTRATASRNLRVALLSVPCPH
jgi:DnaK suppressor protein